MERSYFFARFFLIAAFFLFIKTSVAQQTIIEGHVVDASSGQALVGVNIALENKMIGTASNKDGYFKLKTKSNPPFAILVSYMGFDKQRIEITDRKSMLSIRLKEQPILGQEVVVSASRVEENIMRSPVSIEKLTPIQLQQVSAPNFFDGLYNIKGVDMNVHSLIFRYPNTRGFTGEANTRMNQIVDGVENIPPGLSFSAGNIFGLSPIDIESVELLVGASSALYGPGGINGSLVMKSKNPFDHPGLSGSVQTGLMHVDRNYMDPSLMGDFSFRFAKTYKNRFAIKIVGRYLNANDWEARDFRDRNHLDEPWINRQNYEGYDGVNVYGDDIIAPVNLRNINDTFPDQIITRNGWKEEHLVDYNTKLMVMDASLHYLINEKLESFVRINHGKGTSVYTAQHRFALKNFTMTTIHGELKHPNFYVRAYTTSDNSGDTYNAGQTALIMNEKWKASDEWYADYIFNFLNSYVYEGKSLEESYKIARMVANNRREDGSIYKKKLPAFPLPGTEEFNTMFEDIISKPLKEGGSKVIDNSRLYHIEGMYNFKEHFNVVDLIVGASYRRYRINSEGTVFADEPGKHITIDQFGSFFQLTKLLMQNKMKLTLAGRFDKNQYFKGRFTPRFSMVYSFDEGHDHNLRTSIQTAYRFPSVADQWVNLQVGPYKVVGGLPEVQEMNGFNDAPLYPLSNRNPITGEPVTENGPYEIPEFRPERVLTYEIGYKGLFLKKKLYLDTYVFINRYNGFIATQVLVQYPGTEEEKRFQTTVSTDEPITSFGWAIGLDYRTPRGFMVRGNIAYNALTNPEEPVEGFESRFNTPRYRFNISAGKPEVFKNIGFNISYRWQDEFLWQSAFGTAEIPAFSILDGHISYKLNKLNTRIKLGASNLLNKSYTTSYGSAQIGGLYYITIVYDQLMN